MEIKELGTYLRVDDDGYLISEASEDKIQEKWKGVITDFVSKFVQVYGGNLHSIYIRGSVAKGLAIDNISDLDAFLVTLKEVPESKMTWIPAFIDKLNEKYPFSTKFERDHYTLEEILESKSNVLIKVQSVCVYGKSLIDELPKFKPGIETAVMLPGQKDAVMNMLSRFETNADLDEAKVTRWCVWFMKRTLRCAHELVAERSQRFTRDLYRCWEGFSEYYPQKKGEMYQVLNLSLNPTSDIAEITEVMNKIGMWVYNEGDAQGLIDHKSTTPNRF